MKCKHSTKFKGKEGFTENIEFLWTFYIPRLTRTKKNHLAMLALCLYWKNAILTGHLLCTFRGRGAGEVQDQDSLYIFCAPSPPECSVAKGITFLSAHFHWRCSQRWTFRDPFRRRGKHWVLEERGNFHEERGNFEQDRWSERG